jgi:hypothetical protein
LISVDLWQWPNAGGVWLFCDPLISVDFWQWPNAGCLAFFLSLDFGGLLAMAERGVFGFFSFP